VRGALAGDLRIGAHELRGVIRLAGVDAAQPPVGVQVDPGVDAFGRLVAGPGAVRLLDEQAQRPEQGLGRRFAVDAGVVGGARLGVRVGVVVHPLAASRNLRERPLDSLVDEVRSGQLRHPFARLPLAWGDRTGVRSRCQPAPRGRLSFVRRRCAAVPAVADAGLTARRRHGIAHR
jgi:hypothetical protein